jgi:LmbE family N-acetylglucosaminyl deacetylase
MCRESVDNRRGLGTIAEAPTPALTPDGRRSLVERTRTRSRRRGTATRETDLVVVAHPDDETISLSVQLIRSAAHCKLLTVTDGAPRDERLRPPGFATREHLASVRRRELLEAMAIAGLRSDQCIGLGFVDQEVADQMVKLTNLLAELLQQHLPTRIYTHPYEGGHPDHDATAFAVHHALERLRAQGRRLPALYEFASYHRRGGKLRVFQFLRPGDQPIRTVLLSAAEREQKRRMYNCYASQQPLDVFPIRIERFRLAPKYDFTRALVSTFHRYPWCARGLGLAWFRRLAIEARARLMARERR